jgi:hypothetical protein
MTGNSFRFQKLGARWETTFIAFFDGFRKIKDQRFCDILGAAENSSAGVVRERCD